MTRLWNEIVGFVADRLPGGVPLLALLSLLVTAVIALAWYFWPNWLPWNWRAGGIERVERAEQEPTAARRRFRFPRLRWRWKWRWRRRRPVPSRVGTPDLPDDELPDLPAADLILSADQLAAAGRYKEAVRERLRAIVRDLVDRGLIPISPGWTVTELAGYARRTRPDLASPLGLGANVFSEIWYGLRPAHAEDDAALRAAAAEVSALLLVRAGNTGGAA